MKKNRQFATTQQKGEVRIIAGRWRGRKLPVLMLQGLRPTGDRVKETLFNWLMADIVGSQCLDCFAGSGALGFEALSRQAKTVVFIERDKQVAKQLQQNLRQLACNETQAQVIQADTLAWLKQPPAQPLFDVVFIDPPFHYGLAQQTIALLEQYQWLKPKALIYVETEKQQPIDAPPHWQLLKQKITGQVCYRLYRC